MNELRPLFLLDPDIIFLNHGSFGATPRPVFESYQAWQRRLERQPVLFLGREVYGHLRQARQALADYLAVAAEDLFYIPNATFGVNVVARSLALGPGDEVLTTNHEYGACDRTWQFLSRKRGFEVVSQSISLGATPAEIVDALWDGVTSQTRLLFLSHITSATAVTFPVADICRRARDAGILTLVDGAHAPGQIPLDLPAIGADFYTGNCHKWLCSPKGSGFLYARPERQELVEPLVVSWGWGEGSPFTTGSDFLDHGGWWGTRDPAAYLATPAAIAFQQEHDWTAVRERCHILLADALDRITALTGLPSVYPGGDAYHQMAVAPLPTAVDPERLKARLYDDFRIEVPVYPWNGRCFIRLSVQGYNTQADLDALVDALAGLL